MKAISVILVSYNSSRHIESCLNSIFIQETPNNIEVIVVDNGSKDDTVRIIKDKLYKIVLICNEKNLGFSMALNQGINIATGEYILILNSDIILEKNFIKKLSIQTERLPHHIGMISPKIMCTDKIIDSTGIFISKLRRLHDRGRGCEDRKQFDLPTNIFGPCGACAIYKREMLEDVKIDNEYFDEDFFILVEDFDIAWRANLLGWKGWFIPQLRCSHQGGISRKKSKLLQYYTFRNRYFLLIKNESILGLLKLILFVWCYDLPRLFYLLFTNKYIIKALGEIKQFLPIMIRKRRKIFNRIHIGKLK